MRIVGALKLQVPTGARFPVSRAIQRVTTLLLCPSGVVERRDVLRPVPVPLLPRPPLQRRLGAALILPGQRPIAVKTCLNQVRQVIAPSPIDGHNVLPDRFAFVIVKRISAVRALRPDALHHGICSPSLAAPGPTRAFITSLLA